MAEAASGSDAGIEFSLPSIEDTYARALSDVRNQYTDAALLTVRDRSPSGAPEL